MKVIALLISIIINLALFSQTENPYKSIGKKGEIITLSNGKYQETHPYDSLQKIGSVIINMNTGKIHQILDSITLFSEATLDPTIISRWYSIDPKASKFTDVSPYNFCYNNPIMLIDGDGAEVIAPSPASKELVLKTLSCTFGENNGFSFVNDKLVHNGEVPKNMTTQQEFMFNYFNEALVKSQTPTTIYVNSTSNVHRGANDELYVAFVEDGNALTTYFGASRTFKETEKGKVALIDKSSPAENQISITPKIMKDGIQLTTEQGVLQMGAEHSLLHEFAHAMVNTIMNEYGGKFNDTDFNTMTPEERSDWAIRYTNTLLQSRKEPLETGEGQHGRENGVEPSSGVTPLEVPEKK